MIAHPHLILTAAVAVAMVVVAFAAVSLPETGKHSVVDGCKTWPNVAADCPSEGFTKPVRVISLDRVDTDSMSMRFTNAFD